MGIAPAFLPSAVAQGALGRQDHPFCSITHFDEAGVGEVTVLRYCFGCLGAALLLLLTACAQQVPLAPMVAAAPPRPVVTQNPAIALHAAEALQNRWQASLGQGGQYSGNCVRLGLQQSPMAGACWSNLAKSYGESAHDFAAPGPRFPPPVAEDMAKGRAAAARFFALARSWASACAAMPAGHLQECDRPQLFALMQREKIEANTAFRAGVQRLRGRPLAAGDQ